MNAMMMTRQPGITCCILCEATAGLHAAIVEDDDDQSYLYFLICDDEEACEDRALALPSTRHP